MSVNAQTLRTKTCIGEAGRRLADRFRDHLRDVERNNTNASKPVAGHFNLPYHSHHNMTICGSSLHNRNTENRKNLEEKKSSFNWAHSLHMGSMSAPHSTYLFSKFMSSYFHQWQTSSTLPYKPKTLHNSSICSDEGLTLKTSAS